MLCDSLSLRDLKCYRILSVDNIFPLKLLTALRCSLRNNAFLGKSSVSWPPHRLRDTLRSTLNSVIEGDHRAAAAREKEGGNLAGAVGDVLLS